MGLILNDRELDLSDLGVLQEKFGEAVVYAGEDYLSKPEVGLEDLKRVENLLDQWRELDNEYDVEGIY